MEKYIAPDLDLKAFHCAYCHVYASQSKYPLVYHIYDSNYDLPGYWVTQCGHCDKYSMWHEKSLVFPTINLAPKANPDMPEDVLKSYNEAAAIINISPRAAAALLRLAIQQLCINILGKGGSDLNSAIGKLASQGLPAIVQQALDTIRVIGNNAVHPGQIDCDDANSVNDLFIVTNVITEHLISTPKKITSMFSRLPDTAKQQIAKRDGATTP